MNLSRKPPAASPSVASATKRAAAPESAEKVALSMFSGAPIGFDQIDVGSIRSQKPASLEINRASSWTGWIRKKTEMLKGCAAGDSECTRMFATPDAEIREELRQAARRARKYRARAAENLMLADSALIQEVRDRHRQVAEYYLQLAAKEKLTSLRR